MELTTKTFRGTWLGRPGTSTTIKCKGYSAIALRLIVHRWTDGTDESIAKVVKGDGRVQTPGYRDSWIEYVKIENPTDEQIEDLKSRMIAGEWDQRNQMARC